MVPLPKNNGKLKNSIKKNYEELPPTQLGNGLKLQQSLESGPAQPRSLLSFKIQLLISY